MDDRRLPVMSEPMTDPKAACALPGGLSDEELQIVADMHRLRRRAAEVRVRLDVANGSDEQGRLQCELEALRAERSRLAAQRESAWRDKMIHLGHLDPAAPPRAASPPAVGCFATTTTPTRR
jgi:hypothetical protein